MNRPAVVVAALAAASLAPLAAANAVDVRVAQSVSGGNWHIDGSRSGFGTNKTLSFSFNGGQSFGDTFVAALNLEADRGTGYSRLTTFCIEPTQLLSIPGTYHDAPVDDSVGIDAGELPILEQLWFEKFDLTFDDAGSDTTLEAAAFQTFIWELSEDAGDFDLTSGNMILVGQSSAFAQQVEDLVNTWWGEFNSGAWSGNRTALGALVSGDSQNILREVSAIIPLPSASGMALVGLGIAAGRRRR